MYVPGNARARHHLCEIQGMSQTEVLDDHVMSILQDLSATEAVGIRNIAPAAAEEPTCQVRHLMSLTQATPISTLVPLLTDL